MLSVLRCVSTTSRQQFKQTPTMALYDPSTSSPENIRRLDPKDFEDKHSFAEPEKAVVRHISFTWDVDFTKSIIKGAALLTFESYEPVNSVVLDISKDLEVQSAQLEDGKRVPYSIDSTGLFGGKLTVSLDPCQPQGRFKLRLNYNTSPAASGLQWLDPEQTSAKVAPFLFSQCQPIHARSVFPCQDTPQVKFTYDAEVTAQAKYTVVMSALLTETIDSKNLTEENCKTFKFHQPIPVASYLVAIAVGILGCEKIGPRSKVYAEPDVVSKAAWEFTDTEKFLATAEKMFGPYVWETYDLLVLPPSFPYGGMENPNLTFVTPTLLAGDRSQADVVIHEIMHSWTGNLVTNKNFENFWLNEGFTVFLERKVIGKIWGSKHRDFESLLGYQELEEALSTMSPESNLTKLVPNLDGIHPDEAYSRVPYEKGSLFLRYLEDLVGGPKLFDDFIRAYVQRFERQSVDSEQFKNFFLKHFAGCPALSEIDWDAWLHSPGAPPNYPVLNAELTKPVQKVINKMYDVGVDFISSSDVKGFSPHQMIYLLQEMLRRPPLELKYLREVGKEFKFTESMNTEIQFRWYRLCILSRDQTKIPEIFEFLTTHGRMKYVRPLYRELYKWPEVREQARVNYFKCEPQLMFLTRQALRTELHLNEDCKYKNDGGCKCGS